MAAFCDCTSAEIDVLPSVFTLHCGKLNVLHSTLRITCPTLEYSLVDSDEPR